MMRQTFRGREMDRGLLYMAHPVAPTTDEIDQERSAYFPAAMTDTALAGICVGRNLNRAMQWLSWLGKSFPETTFIAPWISAIMAGEDDLDPNQREAGLLDCCSVVERCDGIVLCGGRISSGMRREMEHGLARGGRQTIDAAGMFEAYDLTSYTIEGESGRNEGGHTFIQWVDRYRESCTR